MTTAPAEPASAPLLGPDDPPPFEWAREAGGAPVVVCCDHASNRVPKALGDLGAVAAAMERHIAYDIGAAGVARRLADLLDAPAILSGYSRLVIDINRDPDDFTSIREIYDRVVVAGNRRLSAADRAQRAAELFQPYHDALAAALEAKRRRVSHPALISVHSCTDVYKGVQRPWHVGVLSNEDRRMAERVMATLAVAHPDLVVGDNKPYSGLDSFGYTIETHARPHGRPNVLFEVRQDLIRTEEGQARFAEILAEALGPCLAEPGLFNAFDG
ncbi:MAG: N-formylglutamate amidohydrolase [Marivibrio sp.]|uniref:N-formylglutamate amidohydrolase n=1 Tax=Marivibrio sp. TaxID=2039719 RepID=UPI0032EE39B6